MVKQTNNWQNAPKAAREVRCRQGVLQKCGARHPHTNGENSEDGPVQSGNFVPVQVTQLSVPAQPPRLLNFPVFSRC